MAVFLLCIHFFAATELTQLFKLPVLLEHYDEHKQKDKALSFGSFLYQHYVADQHNADHPDRDHELPFHSHEDCISFKVSICSPFLFEGLSVPVVYMEKDHKTSFSDHTILFTYLSTIWQPPKTV
jgi:hypothetical protein